MHGNTLTSYSGAFIHKLSSDSLLQIFLACNSCSSRLRWLKLANTCRRLRELALNTPALWSVIVVKRGLACVRACLERSINLKLKLYFYGICSEDLVPALVAAMLPHAHRVHAMRLYADSLGERTLTAILRRLTYILPNLVDLTIQGSHRDAGDKDVFEFTRAQLPSLHSLNLSWMFVSWSSTVMVGLRHLSLSFVESRADLTMDTILDMLERNPLLETLELVSDYDLAAPPPSTYSASELSARKISFPRLRELKLRDTEVNIGGLLEHISFPTSTSVDLGCIFRTAVGQSAAFSLPVPDTLSKLPLLTNIQSIAVTVSSCDVLVRCSTNPAQGGSSALTNALSKPAASHLSLYSEYAHSQDDGVLFAAALAALAVVFAPAPVASLTLSGFCHGVRAPDWRTFLSAFPRLIRLDATDLVGFPEDMTPLFQALRAAPRRLGAHAGVVCPRLQVLELSRSIEVQTPSVQVLLKTLARRTALGVRPERVLLYLHPHNGYSTVLLGNLGPATEDVEMEHEHGMMRRICLTL